MNNKDIAQALQDAYKEGFIDGRCSDVDNPINKEMMIEQYDYSDTRVLVNELWNGDITL